MKIVMSNTNFITEEGLQKLRQELEHMKSVERPEISRQIAEARDKGDLSENAEYDAAKEAQGLLEMKISKLENMIANARVIDESKIDLSKVQILSKVKLKNLQTGASMEYTLVAEAEANLRENKLSIGTPIAKALMGHKLGDIVEVNIPAGKMKLEIISISI
jgi:transcription elongation factor GreA